MAVRICAPSLCLYLTYTLLITMIFDSKTCYLNDAYSNYIWNRAVEVYVGSDVMKIGGYVGSSRVKFAKASGRMNQHDQISTVQCTRMVKLGKRILLVDLLLLCNDIASNPGPVMLKFVCSTWCRVPK